jgi:hypothetical protein
VEDRRATLNSITAALLGHVSTEAQADLRAEDPFAAVELYFGPIAFQALPSRKIASGDCSTDGYYDPYIDPIQPWIFYADDVHERRVRFTVLHELGHHLLATSAVALLDDLDRLGGSPEGAVQAEEAVCHRLAGHLLVPDQVLRTTIGSSRIVPEHLRQLHDGDAGASWESIAIRIAEAMPGPGAIVLLRDNITISFCAASSGLGWSWWQRGSALDPNGPLAHALSRRQTAQPETYRFGLGYPKAMFCDTLPIHEGLAVGVLSEKPSDGSLSIIEEPEPAWKERVEFCAWHPGVERDVGWCHRCKGRRCPECGRCGCKQPVVNPLCPSCGLLSPFRPGATVCRDCE